MHTIKDPGLRRNEKECSFQNPAISVRPQLAGHHKLLTPPLLHPQEYILKPPPPLGPDGGVLLDSSLHGKMYRHTDEPHSLDPDDLKEWGCEAALALLLTSSPGTTSGYLDGSASALGYGSAATLFFPNGSRWVLCQTSPYQSFSKVFDLVHLPSCLKLRSTTGTSSRMNTDSVFVEICSQIIGMVPWFRPEFRPSSACQLYQ